MELRSRLRMRHRCLWMTLLSLVPLELQQPEQA
jgi:hypothetical protein